MSNAIRIKKQASFPATLFAIAYAYRRRSRGRYRGYVEAFPGIRSLAAEFGGDKIGVYKLVRVENVKRQASISLGNSKTKVPRLLY